MSLAKALLAASPWTRVLTPQQLERVQADTFTRTYTKGSLVFRKGAPPSHWIGIAEGLAKMSCTNAGGRVTTLAAASTGAWVGEGTLLKREPFRYEGMALRDTVIAFLPQSTFHWLLDNNSGFTRFLLEQMNERMSYFVGMLEFDRLSDPDVRVAHCLAACFNPLLSPGLGSMIEVTQDEIAHLAGISRQRLSRALGRLETAGLVHIEYGRVSIKDLEGLRRLE